MRFQETELAGAWVVDLEPHGDERGFFARAFCAREFADRGLSTVVAQTNVAYNRRRGTVRGLHFQRQPAAETKLVRCVRGAIWDVIIDLRDASPTRLQHVGVTLSADNHRALYVPKGFAHGYQTLEGGTEVLYQVDEFYAPGCESGLHYDDPVLGIRWPVEVTTVSEKDRSWPFLAAATS
ncbi:MAG: dTDP-4-dehydrorhamnose 3,5-epimerase [Actinomycetota bacterium]|nr:dTDP-4-dehydrorhamnose 3,5-epimerase [Actinomycetota bacterium]